MGGWGGTGVGVEGCGVSRRSPWLPSILYMRSPLMSHTATGKSDDDKQLFLSFSFFFKLPLKLSSSPLMENLK